MAQDDAEAGADLVDLLAGVNGAVVDVQGLRDAAFVEGAFERRDQVVRVLREEELAVGHHPAGIVDEGDQSWPVSRSCRFSRTDRSGCPVATFRWRIVWKRPAGACCRSWRPA